MIVKREIIFDRVHEYAHNRAQTVVHGTGEGKR